MLRFLVAATVYMKIFCHVYVSEASSEYACGPPPTVSHAQFRITAESHLLNVSYLCNAGMQLVGPETLTCLADGTWSLPAPTCEGTEAGLRMSSWFYLSTVCPSNKIYCF